MNIEYTARYGLEFDPFLKNSREIFLDTTEAREAFTRLGHLADTKGFGIITGMPGVGKTTCIRNWCNDLNPSMYKVIYTCLSTLTVNEFYRNLAVLLGVEGAHRKNDNFKLIQDEINRLSLEKKITPVIIIDEANHINSKIMNELKILFNFEMDSRDRAIVLLAGLPPINNILRLAAHEPLRQRIGMNYNMDGLNKPEGRAYITGKLEQAGCTHPIFEDAAIELILNAANGIPRMINRLCSTSMLIGNKDAAPVITTDIVNNAISDCELG